MKITEVKTFAGGGASRRPWVFVKVYSDEGVVGLGEVTGCGQEEAERALIHSPDVSGYLVGKDPLRIEAHLQVIYAGAERWRGDSRECPVGCRCGPVGYCRAGFGGAGASVVGGPVRDKVKVYAHAGGREVGECAENALARMEEGYRAVKFDPLGSMWDPWPSEGEAIARAVKVVAAVHEALDGRAEILIEAHGGMDPRMAIRLGRELEPFRPFFYEEPVPYEDVEAMVRVARSVGIPIASGEHMFPRAMFRPYFEKRAVKIVQPDLIKVGGITECKKIWRYGGALVRGGGAAQFGRTDFDLYGAAAGWGAAEFSDAGGQCR